jgi:5'-3' exonuclease
MGVIIEKLKIKIRQKHDNELLNDKVRYEYEKNKFAWAKINISPGTPFMDKLDIVLINLKDTIKKLCPKLKEYIYSGPDEFGEGEKKIVDYFNDKKISGPITVYSPDSDMTLLCLILSNKINEITILRYNPQDSNYDVINIDTLKKNLCNYVINAINLKDVDVKLNSKNIIDDIVFILTIFGNDFLPKIESSNVKYDFTKIIDKYIKLLLKEKDYIIFDKDNRKILNQKIFIQMLKLLKEQEGANLQNIYITNHYHNYNKLKKIIGAENDNFIMVINDFLDKLRKFNKNIRENKVSIQYWLTEQLKFIEVLKKLTKLPDRIENNNDFIDAYINYYKTNNKLPKVGISLMRYSKSINDSFYRNKLEKSLDNLDDSLKITKYDEEIFKLDNMLDEYVKKLNAQPLDLAYVGVDTKSYMWKAEPINKTVEKYYKNMFGLNMNNVDIVSAQYIEGLVWVLDYYYNPSDTANIWFYKYTNSPLLTQIYDFMEKQDDDYLINVQNNLEKYKIDINKFFKKEEHLIYVSPISVYQQIVPEKYKNTVKKLKFIDVNQIVSDVISKDVSTEIDCRGITFLNSCHVSQLHISIDVMESWIDDLKFIETLRKL